MRGWGRALLPDAGTRSRGVAIRGAQGRLPELSAAPFDMLLRDSAYLHPGHVTVASRATAVTTILGSCVAVCLWDPAARLGGINHFLLPSVTEGSHASSPRFGNVAVGQLVERVLALGARREGLQAKIFGGACVIEAFQNRQVDDHLGHKNVEVAQTLLREARIPVVAEDVGGRRGRKVIFHTDSGVALVRLI
jgi:chemotaxis protein CheD